MECKLAVVNTSIQEIENMIWEVEDESESSQLEICLDSVGALDLSKFKQGASKESKFSELCEVCGDKSTGRHILKGIYRIFILIFRSTLWRNQL